MNKAELVANIASKAGISKRLANGVLDATIQAIMEAMSSGEKIQLPGFGSFEVMERSGRVARNPQTNEEMRLASKRIPVFKAGKFLKECVSAEQR